MFQISGAPILFDGNLCQEKENIILGTISEESTISNVFMN